MILLYKRMVAVNQKFVDVSHKPNKTKINKKDLKWVNNKDLNWDKLNEEGMARRGYAIDPELSSKDYTTYYNSKTKKSSIKYRGTDPTNWRDLTTDALVAVGAQGLGSRFKRAEKVYDKAVVKYGKDNVNVYGHSLGGSQALYVNMTRGAKAEAFNPGAGPLEPVKHLYNKTAAALGNKKAKRRIKNQKDNARVTRNVGDFISLFSELGGDYKVKTQLSLPFSHSQSTL